MDHVRFRHRPQLREPVIVAAFEGWNDAGDAATSAVKYLAERWHAEPFADIDPEEFFDFTSNRPQVRLRDGVTRTIEWPSNEFFAGTVPETDTDVVLLLGTEPGLKWRTFCRQVTDLAHSLNSPMVLTLGALLAEVAHTRPVSVIGTAMSDDLIDRLDLRRSNYEGPTGIVGTLTVAGHEAGLRVASLWAAVPTYVPGAPSPKAALALVERAADLLDLPIHTTDLQIRAAAYERQISNLVADDDDISEYVARLESQEAEVDDDDVNVFDLGSADELVEQVERYLRDLPE